MKVVIDEDVIKNKDLDLSEVLVFLAVKAGGDIPSLYAKMLKEGLIFEEEDLLNNKTFSVSASYDTRVVEALLDSEVSDIADNDKKLTELAENLIALYPRGIKDGTNIPWRSNKRDIVHRLKKFFKFYGQYDENDVYEATKHYVKKYENNSDYMRVLKYFIMKDTSRNGGGIESDLASYLESYQDDDDGDTNWINNIR